MKTIKINDETTERLNRIKGHLIIRDSVNYSYDDTLKEIIQFYEQKGGLK